MGEERIISNECSPMIVVNDTSKQKEEVVAGCRERWGHIVGIMMEMNGLFGWNRLKISSLLSLPDDVSALYDALETECGYLPLQHSERKQYYRSFFKKACGSAVINSLQLEELIHEQVDIGDLDFQEMINNLPVNNGLFDFKSFISLVCEILLSNLLKEQKNKIACWRYWYHRMIPIDPNSSPKQVWDVMILFLLVYSCFQVPYSMAFDDSGESEDQLSPKYIADVLLDVIFMVDVAMCFITAYYDSKGMLVRDLSLISKRYTSTWFVPDLGGSFPFDTVISLFLTSTGNIGAMRVLKLVRLLKLIRAVRVFHFLGELAHKDGFSWLKSTIGVSRSLFLIIFFAHALGCFFYLFFVPDYDSNWMYAYRADLRIADDWTRYVTAMYWATISITTMGYGDIVPVTHSERIFCIVVALVGAVVFSYCMGTITSLVNSVTGADYRIAEKLQHATEYLLFRESTTKLKRLIKSFYNLSWRKSGELYKEPQILSELSTRLRKALLAEVGVKERDHIPLFQGFEDECIGYIFTLLSRVDFIDGDVIYHKGDRAEDMYLVTYGTVCMHVDSVRRNSENQVRSGRARVTEAGGSFGELSLFPDLLPPVRYETAVASSWVIAYTLAAADVPRLQAKYPHVVSRLREFCQLKIADGRARGHTFDSKRSLMRIGGAVKHCKLSTSIAQMQRDLLRVKEQRELIPLAGDFGLQAKRLLKLLICSDGHDDNDEMDDGMLISVSCVVSSEGELLCIENTTAGIIGEGLKSLAFVVPGLSKYRVLESDEIRLGLSRTTNGGAQLFGCCISVFPRPLLQSRAYSSCRGNAAESEVREVKLYTWLEEELEMLFESLDHWTQCGRVIEGGPQKGYLSGFACLPQAGDSPLQQPDATPNLFNQSLVASDTSSLFDSNESERQQETLPLDVSVSSAKLKARSELVRRLDVKKGLEAQISTHNAKKRNGSTARLSAVGDSRAEDMLNKSSRPTAIGGSKSKKYGCLSADHILEHVDWLLSLEIGFDAKNERQPHILCMALTRYLTLVRLLLDSLYDAADGSSDDSLLNTVSFREMNDIVLAKSLSVPYATCTANVNGGSFGLDVLISGSDVATDIHPVNDERRTGIQQTENANGVSECTFTNAESRWEVLVEHLMETNGIIGWKRVQRTLMGLPTNIVSIYDHLQAEEGRVFDHNCRKMYYNAFFKKASGVSVINSLQMEELVQEQVVIGAADLLELMNNLPVNNGLFDFRSFIWILSAVMRKNELIEQQNKIACWKYWYNRLIPIHPDAVPKQVWDVLILLLLLYSCFQVPYSMAFDDSSTDPRSPAYAVDVLLDVIFMTDVALCFLTAYYDAKGMLVKDLWEICCRYSKSWFLPDVGGSFPFDSVVGLFLDQTGNISAMRVLKLVRLMKLLRALRVFRALNELGNREGLGGVKNAIGIFRALFALIFAAHLLGCFFVMLIPDNPNDNWLIDYQPALMQADDWTRYITCLYWAIISVTTLGYGDIKPENGEERIYGIFVALAGAMTFSFCMGTVSSLIASVTGSRFRIMERETDITEYLHFRELSSDLKSKIRTYYSLSWRKSGDLFQESQIMCELSSNLKKAVLKEIGARNKIHIPILQGFEDECIGYIFTRLKRVDFMDGDVIYQKEDRAAEMFFVNSGVVKIHFGKVHSQHKQQQENVKNSRAGKVIESGGTFGELAIFPDLISPLRYESAVASSWVIAYTLAQDEIPGLRAMYPEVIMRLHELCLLKIADGRARGHLVSAQAQLHSIAGASVKNCKLKTMIAQMQRDLLQVKEQSELMTASLELGQHKKKLLKLLVKSDKKDENCLNNSSQLTSVSFVLSCEGELLCIEHTTSGITRENPKSLGFVMPGKSTYRQLNTDEVRRLLGYVGRGGAQLFGFCVSLYSQRPSAYTPKSSSNFDFNCHNHTSCLEQDVYLYSWLEEELDALVELLDAYCGDALQNK